MGRLINTDDLNIVSKGYLMDWFINSVSDSDTTIWTEDHVSELFKDFYCIPTSNLIALKGGEQG